ncbi:MAG: UDP-N-acetylglucosamine pyrophosphorylase [Saccharofermentanales bacterium]|jgi:bifunctional N-acetylglucosamine-1-phosphate-uridyltransferase/glucosamine-1-phosphate-acetyltransferase GlmU-like protein
MLLEHIKTHHFFHVDGRHPLHPLFEPSEFPWDMLDGIAEFIRALGAQLSDERFERRGEDIWVAKTANVHPYATLRGPVIVGEGAEIRPGAFIRGSAYIGADSVVGTATEIKNALLIQSVDVPHYNYVGDSILAQGAHFGAGVITSNLRSDRANIVVRLEDGTVETGRRKIGAMVGERVEVGCNSVLNPGVFIGEHALVYPLSSVRRNVPSHHIYKNTGEVIVRLRADATP